MHQNASSKMNISYVLLSSKENVNSLHKDIPYSATRGKVVLKAGCFEGILLQPTVLLQGLNPPHHQVTEKDLKCNYKSALAQSLSIDHIMT